LFGVKFMYVTHSQTENDGNEHGSPNCMFGGPDRPKKDYPHFENRCVVLSFSCECPHLHQEWVRGEVATPIGLTALNLRQK
jgi:hypothetical protein